MLSIEDAQTILNKNYHDLTKAQKSQLIKLNQQISQTIYAPNNLHDTIVKAIKTTSELSSNTDYLSQSKYYDNYLAPKQSNYDISVKDNLTFNTYKKYINQKARPKPLRMYYLLKVLNSTSTPNFSNEYDRINFYSNNQIATYESAIFKNGISINLYLMNVVQNSFDSLLKINKVLEELFPHPIHNWKEEEILMDAYSKFGRSGKDKFNLVKLIARFEFGMNAIKDGENTPEFMISSNYINYILSTYYQTQYASLKKAIQSSFPIAYNVINNLDTNSLYKYFEKIDFFFANEIDKILTAEVQHQTNNQIQFNENQFIFNCTVKILKDILSEELVKQTPKFI